MAKITNILVILIIGLFLIAGCTPKETSGPSPKSLPPKDVPDTKNGNEAVVNAPLPVPSDNTKNVPEMVKQEVKEFNMEAKQWEFIPSTITVKQGDKVILHITSTDVKHGFSLSEFGIKEELNPGETTTVEFIADKKGTFSFFCNVQCGAGHTGMKGNIVIG